MGERFRRVLRGIRSPLDSGSIIGRISPGRGPAEQLSISEVLGLGVNLGDLADVSLSAEADTEVLTYETSSGLWKNVAGGSGGGGGGGGQNFVWPPGIDNAFNAGAQAFKGNLIKPFMDMTITGISVYIASVSGHTYKAAVYRIDGSDNIDEITAESAATASPGTFASGTTIYLDLTADASLTAGSEYVVVFGRTDSTGTYAIPISSMNLGADEIHYPNAPITPYNRSTSLPGAYVSIASASPTISTAVTVTAAVGNFAVGFSFNVDLSGGATSSPQNFLSDRQRQSATTKSGSAFASKGIEFSPTVNFDIHRASCWMLPVSGASYTACIAEMSASRATSISAVPTFSATLSPGTDVTPRWLQFEFTSAVSVVADSFYALLISRTDGGDTYALPLGFSITQASPDASLDLPLIPDDSFVRVAKAAPANGDTLDRATGSQATVGMMIELT